LIKLRKKFESFKREFRLSRSEANNSFTQGYQSGSLCFRYGLGL